MSNNKIDRISEAKVRQLKNVSFYKAVFFKFNKIPLIYDTTLDY